MKDKLIDTKGNKMYWRVHMPNLLKEIMTNPSAWVLAAPLQILGTIMYELGELAADINDERLNTLMMRLTIYEAADPTSPHYDKKLVEKFLK